MGSSIQEIGKKINSGLSPFDSLSLSITSLFLAACAIWLMADSAKNTTPVTYIESEGTVLGEVADNRPFGSVNGPTYTFSWCQGSSSILPKNKIYFTDA